MSYPVFTFSFPVACLSSCAVGGRCIVGFACVVSNSMDGAALGLHTVTFLLNLISPVQSLVCVS